MSAVSSYLVISSRLLSVHLSLGRPLLLFPGTTTSIIFLDKLSSSLLLTCPYQCNRFCLRNVDIWHTLASSYIVLFLTWSFLVLPLIHRSILISATCNLFSSFFLTAYMSTWQKLNDGVFPTDDARARWLGMGVTYVHRTCRAQSIRRRTFNPNPRVYGAPFSHVFTELKISPIEVHISAIQLQISPIHLKISSNQLEISTIKPIWRYLQLIWRYLQMNWRYLQIGRIWRYLQFIWRYLQIDKSDTISAPRRKNHCAMIQVNGLIKSPYIKNILYY